MRLGDNKVAITYDKVSKRICHKEGSIWDSNIGIYFNQSIWISDLINSDYLLRNIYHNEINR